RTCCWRGAPATTPAPRSSRRSTCGRPIACGCWPGRRDPARSDRMRARMPIADSVTLEDGVVIFHRDLVNLYGCHVGAGTKIGALVEIQKGAAIGRRCKISSHTFVCEGVTVEDDVFVGHGVMFINDPSPPATLHGQLH